MTDFNLAAQFSEQPFLLAPMAGVTDAAYRIMCRRHGAPMAYSEMVSVAGLAYASAKTWDLVLPHEDEPQICVQLFGSKPEQFREAVCQVQERVGDKLSLIDINMACPARKVVTKGEGSALMRTPELAEQIAAAAVGEAQVPVTVKIRAGFAAHELTAPDFARRMEQAGVSAVAVHGRTASQLYTGDADWGVVDKVAGAVGVPVIGSGDVLSAEAAVRMLATTRASAVFIARGTYGNPWIFEDAMALHRGEVPAKHSFDERLDALGEHLDLLHALDAHMARARTFSTWYLKGMPHAASWRGRVVRCTTYEDFRSLLDDIRADVTASVELMDAYGSVPPAPLDSVAR